MGYAYDEPPFDPLRTTTRHTTLPDKDAEIARLRAELARLNGILDAERDMQAKLVAEGTRLSAELAAARAALATEREACDEWGSVVRNDYTIDAVKAVRLANALVCRRAAEAKANPYPFTVESSPSAPDGTVAVVRDGKAVGGIVGIGDAAAKGAQ